MLYLQVIWFSHQNKERFAPHAHRFVLQIELANQLPVVGRIHHLAPDEKLDLCVRSVGLDPVEDSTADRANCVIGVRPDVQVVHLPPLVGEADDQRDVLPAEGPAVAKGNKKKAVGRGKQTTVKLEFSLHNSICTDT